MGNGDSNSDRQPNTHRHNDGDAYCYTNAYLLGRTNADPDADSNSDAHSYGNAHSNTHSWADCDADTHRNTNSDAHSNTDGQTYSNTNGDAHRNSNTIPDTPRDILRRSYWCDIERCSAWRPVKPQRQRVCIWNADWCLHHQGILLCGYVSRNLVRITFI